MNKILDFPQDKELLEAYLFLSNKTSNNTLISYDPYSRYIDNEACKLINLENPLRKDNYFSIEALYAQKILTNIYEYDLLFLKKDNNITDHLESFYSEEKRKYGVLLKSKLEHFLFSFIDNELDIGGNWEYDNLIQYLKNIPIMHKKTDSIVVEEITKSLKPQVFLKNYIIQLAIDFLTEASALARVTLGNYGEVQSEIFKILIDEYGYGVFKTKHSTLFENIMKDLKLENKPHAYWQFYYSSSIGVHNYFHYHAINYKYFFRYIGMIYAAESTFSHTCKQFSSLIKEVFNKKIDTGYFDEHVGIDFFHTDMSLNKVLLPLVQQYGNSIIPEIIKGCESFNLIIQLNDIEFTEQTKWSSNFEKENIEKSVSLNNYNDMQIKHIIPSKDTSISIEKGEVYLILGLEKSFLFSQGENFIIPAKRHIILLFKDEDQWNKKDVL